MTISPLRGVHLISGKCTVYLMNDGVVESVMLLPLFCFGECVTGLLPGHLFSSGEMAGGRSKISSALNRLALEIPLDLYCMVFTNIKEHT